MRRGETALVVGILSRFGGAVLRCDRDAFSLQPLAWLENVGIVCCCFVVDPEKILAMLRFKRIRNYPKYVILGTVYIKTIG